MPLLGGLEKQYLLSVRLSVKNIPPAMRKTAMDMLKFGMQVRLIPRPNEDRDQYAARAAMTQKLFQGVVAFLNDLDEVLFGLSVDAERGAAFLDCRLTATPGSTMAARLAAYKGFASEFAAFTLPNAAVNACVASPLDDAGVAQAKALLSNLRAKAAKELDNAGMTPNQSKAAKELLSEVLGVAEKTLDGKKLDWGMSVALKPGASAVVVGGSIADGQTLDEAVRRLAAEIGQKDPEFAKRVQLDAESVGDVRLHVLTQTIPPRVRPAADGRGVRAVMGIGGQRLYLGVGNGATQLLKEAIAKASAPRRRKARRCASRPPARRWLSSSPTSPPRTGRRRRAATYAACCGRRQGPPRLHRGPTTNGAEPAAGSGGRAAEVAGHMPEHRDGGGRARPVPPTRKPRPSTRRIARLQIVFACHCWLAQECGFTSAVRRQPALLDKPAVATQSCRRRNRSSLVPPGKDSYNGIGLGAGLFLRNRRRRRRYAQASSERIHAGRTFGRHLHHRPAHCLAAARGRRRPRGCPPINLHEQPPSVVPWLFPA